TASWSGWGKSFGDETISDCGLRIADSKSGLSTRGRLANPQSEIPNPQLTYARRSRGRLPHHLPRARALPVPQGLERRAGGGPGAGGVRSGARTQAREYPGVVIRGGGQHGAGRGPPRGARATPFDAPQERAT